jgi:DNA-binding FadR family transcriptional regulator
VLFRSVNSAVSALSTKGYIRVVPRHYAVVNDFISTGSLAILADIFHSDNKSLRRKMVKETLACRMLVEIDSIKKIASDPIIDLSSLRVLIEKETAWHANPLRKSEKLCEMDLAFHTCIIHLAGNMVFSLIYHTFDYLAQEMIHDFYENPAVILFVLEKHQSIVRSLMERNEQKAVSLMTELLQHGEKELLKSI